MNKKNKIYTVILILFLLLLLGLWWLSLLFVVLVLLYFISLKLIHLIIYPFLKKTVKSLFLFLFIFIVAINVKLLLFDIYKVPSSSMNNTLYTNDVIIVNKLKYGPKLPRSPFEIPWVNIALYFNKKVRARMNVNLWEYKRLSGTSNLRNGDVVVFTMFKKNMTIVKRCMGIAGDTIIIKEGDVYVNNKYFSPSSLILNNYEFKINNKKVFFRKLDSLDLDIVISRAQTDFYRATMSIEEKDTLEKMDMIKGLTIITDSITSTSTAYPNSNYNQWNFDYYGPYIIPKKGMMIPLNQKNYALYNKVINDYDGVTIKSIDGSYFINDIEVTSYTFNQDYYFMMGDNRKGSMDSRYWGLVPEERIIGKVQCVLWSSYQDELQWKRLLKKVE
ncbi:signal peptidase I [Wocania ichthyoenteri]|uniref:signal peptidase I n=1 Tax=Wocania ichthyoenteri TaxID=1230531 RepID=UPI0009DF214B|nr:signal peptidase I [Wocania ichthyoenteri]